MEKEKDWLLFEQEVALLVKAFGYKTENTKPSGDLGVDVIAHSNKRKLVIQCKLYGKGNVGNKTINELLGTKIVFGADEAICVTTSGYTKSAREVAERGGVHLIDREKLVLLCQQKNLTIPSLTALQTKSGHVLSLTQQVTTFGKASGNTLICAHPSVSKHHAVLERSGLYLFIKDCGSTNGTFVNEHKLGKFAVLNYGDVIRLGAVSMCVILKPKTGNQS